MSEGYYVVAINREDNWIKLSRKFAGETIRFRDDKNNDCEFELGYRLILDPEYTAEQWMEDHRKFNKERDEHERSV